MAGEGARTRAWKRPSASSAAASILVPPKSTPMRIMRRSLTEHRANGRAVHGRALLGFQPRRQRLEVAQREDAMKIYPAPRSRSLRVVWAAEELGIPYETVTASFAKPDP